MDLRLTGKNNQAKEVVAARSEEFTTKEDAVLFSIPRDSIIRSVTVVVDSKDTGSGSKMIVNINGTDLTEFSLDTEEISTYTITDKRAYVKTGGLLNVKFEGCNGDGTVLVAVDLITNNTTGAYLG